jgi:hypothetical protein
MAAELIRRGLPANYAQRAIGELADHHRDLVEELQAAGWTDFHAQGEASRRLGDPHALVKKTVREFQRRHWCGRWPLIAFLLSPVPAFFAACYLTGLVAVGIGKLIGKGPAPTPIETWIGITIAYAVKFWLTLVIPAILAAFLCRVADRAAMRRIWPCLAGIVLMMFVGFLQCNVAVHPTQPHAKSFFFSYYMWFLPEGRYAGLFGFFWKWPWQLAQLMLPLAVTCGAMLYQALRVRHELESFRETG